MTFELLGSGGQISREYKTLSQPAFQQTSLWRVRLLSESGGGSGIFYVFILSRWLDEGRPEWAIGAMAINPPAATRHLHMHVYLAGTQLCLVQLREPNWAGL